MSKERLEAVASASAEAEHQRDIAKGSPEEGVALVAAVLFVGCQLQRVAESLENIERNGVGVLDYGRA